MAPITTASDETNHMALLDKLDMAKIHKPFRNPNYKAPQRRNKNLKQILSEAQRKEAQSLLATTTTNTSGAATPLTEDAAAPAAIAAGGTALDPSRATTLSLPIVPSYSYTSIQAAPSLKPKMKYCDITGLPAKYQDPKTGLRYCNQEAYGVVRTLNTAQVQEYLATRGANTVLK